MMSYQCSRVSAPESIISVFEQCRNLQVDKNLDEYAAVVVLDEVGLAEDSEQMPLKVIRLHISHSALSFALLENGVPINPYFLYCIRK